MNHSFLAAGILLFVFGCTAQDGYEFTESIGRSKADCEALINQDERDRCEASFAQPYDEYTKERNAVVDDDS